jgi:uncharacterized protein YktA (UPF0223 family)
MTEQTIKQAIQATELFKQYPRFKKSITLSQNNLKRLWNLYGQADRLGIEYLKQNPALTSSDVNLVNELLNKRLT